MWIDFMRMPELSHFSYKKACYSSQDESRTLGRTLGQFLLAERSRPETDATFPRLAQLGQATSFPSDPKNISQQEGPKSPKPRPLSAQRWRHVRRGNYGNPYPFQIQAGANAFPTPNLVPHFLGIPLRSQVQSVTGLLQSRRDHDRDWVFKGDKGPDTWVPRPGLTSPTGLVPIGHFRWKDGAAQLKASFHRDFWGCAEGDGLTLDCTSQKPSGILRVWDSISQASLPVLELSDLEGAFILLCSL